MNIEPGHHAEPHKTGHRWLDIGMALAILIVSISSLVVAIVHSQTLERMADANAKLVETNSWPFLAYDTSNGETTGMSIVNDGVGPAKVEAVEVKWNGRSYTDAVAFLQGCCGLIPHNDVEYGFIEGRVLRAGQSLNILALQHTPTNDGAWKALNDARLSRALSIDICYCSVFDQCWAGDIARLSLKPHEVERCSVPATPFGLPH